MDEHKQLRMPVSSAAQWAAAKLKGLFGWDTDSQDPVFIPDDGQDPVHLARRADGLDTATTLVGTELVVVLQGGMQKKTAISNVATTGVVLSTPGKVGSAYVDGGGNTAAEEWSFAQGNDCHATQMYASAMGNQCTASGYAAHAEGQQNTATPNYSHAEGSQNTIATGSDSAHAEGNGNAIEVNANQAHVEGLGNTISTGATYAHAEGGDNTASGIAAHVEGIGNDATGYAAHAEGTGGLSSAQATHTEGQNAIASANYAHAEGNNCHATAIAAHAEGENCHATAIASHAEGQTATASGYGSHAEGTGSTASGAGAHAEGQGNTAAGDDSHAAGQSNTAKFLQYVVGIFAEIDSAISNTVRTAGQRIFKVGIGTADGSRKDGFWVDDTGKGCFAGGLQGTTTNDSAPAGCVGELLSSIVPIGSHVSLTTTTSKDVTSLTLGPGEWDSWCVAVVDPASTASYTAAPIASLSLSADTHDPIFGDEAPLSAYPKHMNPAHRPVKVASGATATIHMVMSAEFGAGNLYAYGNLYAKRVR